VEISDRGHAAAEIDHPVIICDAHAQLLVGPLGPFTKFAFNALGMVIGL